MMLEYQSSQNAGYLTVYIDGSEVTISQLVGTAWFSQELDWSPEHILRFLLIRTELR